MDEIDILKQKLAAKDSLCQSYQKKFSDNPPDLEPLRSFPEFYSETVQNKYLKLKSNLPDFTKYLPQQNTENPKVGPYFYPEESSVYHGQYYKHLRHGFGKIIYKNGSFYQGTFLNDLFEETY